MSVTGWTTTSCPPGDHLVGVVHPGRGPDQIAGKGQQTSTMRAVHPYQPRVAATLPFLPIDKRRIELRSIAGQQGAIHVQEQQRTADHHGNLSSSASTRRRNYRADLGRGTSRGCDLRRYRNCGDLLQIRFSGM